LLCAGRFGRAGALAMLPRLLLGRHLGHPRVQTRRFRQLHLRAARPLPLAADGEPMAAVSELRVVVLHGALRVVRA
jgi:diacylglycerol kinase (ATP)